MFAFAQNASAHDDSSKDQGDGSVRTVSMADNGDVLVRGARVTAVNDDAISATVAWNSLSLAWTLETDGDTGYVKKDNGGLARGDIAVGDTISFTGDLVTSASALTVSVDTLKDWTRPVDSDDGDDDNGNGNGNNGKHLGWFNWLKDWPIKLGHK
jgi:hypothetical protein